MAWELATDANIRLLPPHERFFAYAYAYLNAANVLCEWAITRAEDRDWTAGAVVLMNAAHAVELFLKAMLLRRNSTFDAGKFGHDIGTLALEYGKQFTEPDWAWDVPFRQIRPAGISPEEERVIRAGMAPPSVEYRYPVARDGEPWLTLHAFEPHSFARELGSLRSTFDRLYQLGTT